MTWALQIWYPQRVLEESWNPQFTDIKGWLCLYVVFYFSSLLFSFWEIPISGFPVLFLIFLLLFSHSCPQSGKFSGAFSTLFTSIVTLLTSKHPFLITCFVFLKNPVLFWSYHFLTSLSLLWFYFVCFLNILFLSLFLFVFLFGQLGFFLPSLWLSSHV